MLCTPRRAAIRLLGGYLTAAVACSSVGGGLLPAGTSCSSDGDCGVGLSCVPILTQSDAGACTLLARACSRSCQTDNDCAVVATGFRCLLCGSAGACVQTR